ncbi:hypothetical protein GCM10022291_31320 [Postechiella marina]|uniref:Uncharacterized protein n=1 Tax=Postechiella marina TaxID=943941 RepID=A0ABP8CH11_9FLAO
MFNKRKNKTFNYKPRFSKESLEQSQLEDKSNQKEFISKWRRETGHKVRMGSVMPVKTVILLLVLLLICMYVLEKNYL